jgi:FixJ family two-component response regulator
MVMSDGSLISIVDDDEATRMAVAALVRSLGFPTAAFENATDFLSSDELSRTACLIADVRMPEMSGPELCSHLMAAGAAIPTILVTGFADDTARVRALKAGVRCYLAKPLKPAELLACIRSAIGEPSRKEPSA